MHARRHARIDPCRTVAGGFSRSAALFHASQAYVPVAEGAGCTHARVHMLRHWFTPHSCRSRPYVEASVQLWEAGSHQRRARRRGRQAAANTEHAEGGGRQLPTQSTQSTLTSIHIHTLMIASVHTRTESRSTPFARVPTSSPSAI